MNKKKLFVISGPSGVGKGTVLKGFLAKHKDFKLSISATTRKPRNAELQGVSYFFLTREEFEKSTQLGDFLEWAEFSGNLYGTKVDFVQKCLEKGNNLILEIDTQGALQVKSKMPEAVLIFIAPPSFDELEKRLRGRNTEDERTIQKRLDFVKLEIKNSAKFDYTIINDTVENVINKLEKVMEC